MYLDHSFVGNLWESPLVQEKALEQILEYELLIQQLNFHLIVHNPYRPFEGYYRPIDLKTRYPLLENPEILRKTLTKCEDITLLFCGVKIGSL